MTRARKAGVAILALVAVIGAAYFLFDYLALLALSVSVSRRPHATIEILAFDERGHGMGSTEFFRTWRPNLVVHDGRGSATFGMQYGLGTPKIAIPPDEPISFELLWPVPEFGKVLMSADNGGAGYRLRAGASTRIELSRELARTRLGQVERWIQQRHGGKPASEQAHNEINIARGFFTVADAEGDARKRAALASSSLRIAAQASEHEVLAEADASIHERRRGRLRIKLVDRRGRPVAGAKIRLSETRPEFLFGVFTYGYDAATIKRLQSLGLNSATLHMNWRQMEPEQDHFAFDDFDRLPGPSRLKNAGFVVRGHALAWFARDVMPPYMNALKGDPAKLSEKVRSHIGAIVKRYRDQVDIWEANNEGHAAWASWGLSREGMDEVVKASADEIHLDAPGKPIMVNAAAPIGENVPLSFYPLLPALSGGTLSPFSIDPCDYFRELDRAGVKYDFVGLQFYYGGTYAPQFGGFHQPAIDLFRFALELERYGRLGKPIYVTEISVGSSHGDDVSSWWHRPADEDTQAEYLEGAFKVAYGDPRVRGINWWDLYDNGSFVASGGLIDKSGRPKRAYGRLASTLREWRSNGVVTTAADGSAYFDGDAGDYQAAADLGGASITSAAHIHAGSENLAVLRMH